MSVYLDHAATTPLRPEALDALRTESAIGGNPSSVHASGRRARRVVEESREAIAAALGAQPPEVVFTAGGTEADNLGVKGLYWKRREADERRRRILIGAVEHHGVIDPAVWLEHHDAAELVWLPVDSNGRVELGALREALDDDPGSIALVAAMWANNEVGTIQPVAEIAAAAAQRGVPVHCDAVQAVGHLPLDFASSGVATLALSGHKLGGPVGSGGLVVRSDVELVPVIHGGGQERGMRSGTIDVPAVAALAAAATSACAEVDVEAARLATLRDDLVRAVRESVPDARLSGPPSSEDRLPGIAHLTFAGCQGDALLYLLDARGIECSTGSACQAGLPQPSHVLRAMGLSDEEARGALRFSLGHTSSEADIKVLRDEIGPVIERARTAGLAGRLAG